MTISSKKKSKGNAGGVLGSSTGASAPNTAIKATGPPKAGKKDVKKKVDTPGGRPRDIPDDGSIDSHPLSIGHNILVQYRDGSHRLAKIIERIRKAESLGSITEEDWNYYVHYYDFNRRMDEWVEISRIITYPSEANVLAEEINIGHDTTTDKTGSAKKHGAAHKSSPKPTDRKAAIGADDIDEKEITTIAELEHDEHEGLDEAQLLEHEEITKIKNISNVVFGKYKVTHRMNY